MRIALLIFVVALTAMAMALAAQAAGTVKLEFPRVKVIAATKDFMDVAADADHQDSDQADVRVVVGKPLLKPPRVFPEIQ